MISSLSTPNLQAAFMARDQELPKIEAGTQNAELKKQTDAFESIIVKMLLDNAMQEEKNLFSEQNDPGDKIYKSMYREELAKASAGGFGFSQMLYEYLSEKQK